MDHINRNEETRDSHDSSPDVRRVVGQLAQLKSTKSTRENELEGRRLKIASPAETFKITKNFIRGIHIDE